MVYRVANDVTDRSDALQPEDTPLVRSSLLANDIVCSLEVLPG